MNRHKKINSNEENAYLLSSVRDLLISLPHPRISLLFLVTPCRLQL